MIDQYRTTLLVALIGLIGIGSRPVSAQLSAPKFVKVSSGAPAGTAPGKPFALTIQVAVDSPYHIQANPPKEGYIATELHIGQVKGVQVGKIDYPKGKEITFSGEKLPAYEGKVNVTAHITIAKAGTYKLPISLRYQGCNDAVCYPPATVTTTVTVTVAAH